ncbi:MAG: hypothetical protein HUJ25_02930 [Crocinitomicaceae bacterium]|nr:hypothetical protein [Crocinitomicaceae bacterium]
MEDFLRVEDLKNKATYEFKLAEVGYVSLRRTLRSIFGQSDSYKLVVHKWDTSTVEVEINKKDIEMSKLKSVLKRVNSYFYTES